MLKVDGQFAISLKVDGAATTGVYTPDLRELEMIEVAGVGLPMIRGMVVSRESTSREMFHEGNKITVSYGVGKTSNSEMIDTRYVITNVSTVRTDSQYNIVFTGVYDAVNYLVEHKQRSIRDKSAIEAMLLVAKDNFTQIDSNIPKSEDQMIWLQPGITNKKFMAETWFHADLPESFPMMGITIDGRFLLRDFKTLLAAGHKWEFFPNVPKPSGNKIWYHGDYTINTNSGFMNYWLGYGNILDVRDQELGEYEEVWSDIAPQMTKAASYPRLEETPYRRGTPQWLTDNMHPRWWHAYQHNTTQLAQYSTVKVTLNYDNLLKKTMRILDLVYFAEADNTKNAYDNPFTGLYIISKLSRRFTDKKVITTVELCRESLADIKGAVR